MWSKIFRGLWFLSFVTAFAAILVATRQLVVQGDTAAWATIASALAVVASLIAAWTAQRVFELQEEAKRPYVYPIFDTSSRYGLVQLRMTNYGGGVAKGIILNWQKPLLNGDGNPVRFSENYYDIPVLLPGTYVNTQIDGSINLMERYKDQELDFTGIVVFSDAAGKIYREEFILSLSQYTHSLYFDQEEPKTHHEIQKIPNGVQSLTSEVRNLRQIAELVWAEKLESEKQKIIDRRNKK